MADDGAHDISPHTEHRNRSLLVTLPRVCQFHECRIQITVDGYRGEDQPVWDVAESSTLVMIRMEKHCERNRTAFQ